MATPENSSPEETPAEGAPRQRWRKLKVLAAACALVSTVFAVLILWRPAGASGGGTPGEMVKTLATSELPGGMLQLLFQGSTSLTLRDDDICYLAALLLDRDSKFLPESVRESVRREVHDVVETAAGCRIEDGRLVMYFRCRKVATFYVTTSSTLELLEDGGVLVRLSGARVGALPLPVKLAEDIGGFRPEWAISPEDTGMVATGLTVEEGYITIDLETGQEVI